MILQGDSLMVGMAAHLHASSVSAGVGRHTIDGVYRLRAQHVRGKIVFISLGTNDLGRSAAWMAEEARTVLEMRPKLVVWGEIRVSGRQKLASPLNQGLKSVRSDRLRLVWPPTPDAGDGIHYTAHGYRVLARKYERSSAS